MLSGGGDEVLAAGTDGGQRPVLADLALVATGLRAERGQAPGGALPVGALEASASRWAGQDGAPASGAPEMLRAAARGLREWAAGMVGVTAEQVTAGQVDAAVRTAAGFFEARGRWPRSAEELGGFAGEQLTAAGVPGPWARGVILAYGRWLRLAGELAGPGAGAALGLHAVTQVDSLAREAAGLGRGDEPVSRAGLEPLLQELFGPRRAERTDLRVGALLGLVSSELRGAGEGAGGGLGQLTVDVLAERVGELLRQLGAVPQGPVAAGGDPRRPGTRGEDPRLGPLLGRLGRELGRGPRDSHAAMLADVLAEHQQELGGAAGGRLARARVPELQDGKLAPRPGARVAARRLLTPGQRALIHGGDRLAGTLEPGEALAERDWAHLRDDTSGMTVPWHIAESTVTGEFTVRRFVVTTGDGRQLRVTEASVTVRLVPDPGMTADEVELAKARLLDGVDVIYNHQHVLADGSQFHYRLVFTDEPDKAQQSPALHPGDGLFTGPGHITSYHLYLGMLGPAWDHEPGHWLGLADWYPSLDSLSRKQPLSPGVRYDSAVMGLPGAWWAGGAPLELRPGGGQGPPVVGLFYGLKDDDLGAVDGLIRQAEEKAAREGAPGVPVAAGHARAREPEEVVYRAAGLPGLADVQVPGHVTTMLAMLPLGERTLEMALLLDYAAAVLGRAPTDAGEARHAVGLVLLAGDVYGGVAFYWSTPGVDQRFARLVAVFAQLTGTADPARYLPGRGELRRLVADLLGLPPSSAVTAAEVDAAARVVERYAAEKSGLPASKVALGEFARGKLPPQVVVAVGDASRAYGRLLQFADELAVTHEERQSADQPNLEVAAQVAALAREAAGLAGPGRPLFRPDLEPLLDRLFGPRPGPEESWEKHWRLDDRRLWTLRWLVWFSLWGGDQGGPLSVASLDVLIGRLLGDTVAPQQRVAGIERLNELAQTVLPGAELTGQVWLDLALVAIALRTRRGLAPGAGLAAGELADFARQQAGEAGGNGGTLTPELLAAAAQRLRAGQVPAAGPALAGGIAPGFQT